MPAAPGVGVSRASVSTSGSGSSGSSALVAHAATGANRRGSRMGRWVGGMTARSLHPFDHFDRRAGQRSQRRLADVSGHRTKFRDVAATSQASVAARAGTRHAAEGSRSPPMRKLLVFESITLDGYFTGKDGELNWAHADPP